MNERVKIEGLVSLTQDRPVFKNRKNHFVDAGLKGVISTMLFSTLQSGGSVAHWYLWASDSDLQIGSDTSNSTTHNMTNLVSLIGTNSYRVVSAGPDGTPTGVWIAIFRGYWNVGTVSGTIGEIGLRMRALDKADFQWYFGPGGTYSPTKIMISRLSAADGDFLPYTIDPTKQLIIEWQVRWQFS